MTVTRPSGGEDRTVGAGKRARRTGGHALTKVVFFSAARKEGLRAWTALSGGSSEIAGGRDGRAVALFVGRAD